VKTLINRDLFLTFLSLYLTHFATSSFFILKEFWYEIFNFRFSHGSVFPGPLGIPIGLARPDLPCQFLLSRPPPAMPRHRLLYLRKLAADPSPLINHTTVPTEGTREYRVPGKGSCPARTGTRIGLLEEIPKSGVQIPCLT
jgi:hypothetical protein